MKSIYLAHPLPRRKDGKAIQAKIEELGLKVFNPFYTEARPEIEFLDRKGGESSRKDDLTIQKQFGNTIFFEIIHRDLFVLNQQDGLVAIIPKDVSLFGTICEAFFMGIIQRKPVFILTELDYLTAHPWLYVVSQGNIFTKEEDLIHALKKWRDKNGE